MWCFSETTISTFTGNATKFQEVDDKKLTAAVDIYISDFGELQIVPNRHMRVRTVSSVDHTPDVLVLDPSYAEVAYLQTAKQEPLAKQLVCQTTPNKLRIWLTGNFAKGTWYRSRYYIRKMVGQKCPIHLTGERNEN